MLWKTEERGNIFNIMFYIFHNYFKELKKTNRIIQKELLLYLLYVCFYNPPPLSWTFKLRGNFERKEEKETTFPRRTQIFKVLVNLCERGLMFTSGADQGAQNRRNKMLHPLWTPSVSPFLHKPLAKKFNCLEKANLHIFPILWKSYNIK